MISLKMKQRKKSHHQTRKIVVLMVLSQKSTVSFLALKSVQKCYQIICQAWTYKQLVSECEPIERSTPFLKVTLILTMEKNNHCSVDFPPSFLTPIGLSDDYIELVPDLVWYRPQIEDTDEVSHAEDLVIFQNQKLSRFSESLRRKFSSETSQIPRASTLQPEQPSILWTSLVIGIIHFLFETFRWPECHHIFLLKMKSLILKLYILFYKSKVIIQDFQAQSLSFVVFLLRSDVNFL